MLLPRRFLPSVTELMAFEAAARQGSFTRGGVDLALTQGAISKLVRQLEQRLGVPLFERTQRRVVLTSAGRSYLPDVQDLLRRLEASTQSVLAAGGSAAVIRIAVLPTFGARWLLPRLPRFARLHPDVTVHFATRLAPFDFERETFDLAIHYGEPNWPGASASHLLDEEIVPVTSRSYRAGLKLARPDDLTRATLIHQATRHDLWNEWFSAVGVWCDKPYRGPMLDQFSLTAQAAANGLGVALVPRFLIEDELASGRLVVLFDQALRSTKAYFVVAPATRQHPQAVIVFRDWLTNEAAMVNSGTNKQSDVNSRDRPSATG